MRNLYKKLKALRLKFLAFTIVLLSVYLFLFYIILIEVQLSHKPAKISSVALPFVVIHLDLKGSPPKLSYLESLLPRLKDLGVNGLLMEYEDMFPYSGQLVNISAKNCYKELELRNFLKKANNAGFEIIPLIQTFGHMEHVLKLEQFQRLREIPMYPDSICPSKTESINVIREMLKQISNHEDLIEVYLQVIKFHHEIFQLNYIHIGCDEVYHINKCYECTNRGLSNIHLYFEHLDTIKDIVLNLSPDTKVLIWDDMLRGIKPSIWNELQHYDKIQPVSWNYQSSQSISHIDLMNYHKKFDSIWIATAFKGADGRAALLPNVTARFYNHYSWLNFIVDYKFGGESQVYTFKGIILTGWSRYSHMDPSCELLPVSIPSLILNLLLIRKFKAGVIFNSDYEGSEFNSFFKGFLEIETNRRLYCGIIDVSNIDFSSCNFEGRDLYTLVKEYIAIKRNVEEMFYGEEFSLSNVEYYSKNKYINMNNVEYYKEWCSKIIKKIEVLQRKLHKVMSKYYDRYFIKEYIDSKTYVIKKKVKNIMKFFITYSKSLTWKRRPTNNNVSLI